MRWCSALGDACIVMTPSMSSQRSSAGLPATKAVNSAKLLGSRL